MILEYLENMDAFFKNTRTFEECYKPKVFRYRETQLAYVAINTYPVLRNAAPYHTLLYGLPGTGKTTTACIILNRLKNKTNNCFLVYIDCKVEKTPSAILKAILTSITGNHLPDAGVPISSLLNNLGTFLIKKNKILVVCLDDINLMPKKKCVNDIISLLLNLPQNHPGLRIGIIVVVNDTDYEINGVTDPATQSDFQPDEIYFPPYSTEQIKSILSERAQAAFHPNVISDNLIHEIALATFQKSDLRIGIHALRRSGTHAVMAGRTTIEPEDVQAILTNNRDPHLYHSVEILSPPELKILDIIVDLSEDLCATYQSGRKKHLSRNDPDILTTGILYREFNAREEIKMSSTTFNDYINHMKSLHLIDTYKHSLPTRGRVMEITLRYEIRDVKAACEYYRDSDGDSQPEACP